MSTTTKKQNRILYTTLAVLLAAAALLIVFTMNAGKKEEENVPETDPAQTQTIREEVPSQEGSPSGSKTDVTEDAGIFGKKEDAETTADSAAPETIPEKTDHTDKKTTDASAAETAAVISLPDTLPTFLSPVADGVILRGHSVTVPVFSPTMDDYRTHTGLDILCDPASPVLAAADGKIGNFWHDPMMGYTLSVIHGGDAVTIYQGLAEELPEGIEPGAYVKAGQVIACSGTTALIECEDEEHVHFMMTVDGRSVDPAEYIALPTMAEVYED